MKAIARLYQPEDYKVISAWWRGHGGAAVPEVMLPELGIIVSSGGDDQAACFVYFDTSRPIAFLAWFVTNPGTSPKEVERALAYLLGAAEAVAKDRTGKVVLPITDKPSLLKWLGKQGYIMGCEGASIMVKTL